MLNAQGLITPFQAVKKRRFMTHPTLPTCLLTITLPGSVVSGARVVLVKVYVLSLRDRADRWTQI
jgi:hypothetical protein